MILSPTDEIKKRLNNKIALNLIEEIPVKWEKIGDVLVVVLPSSLNKYKEVIGRAYADSLKCKTVLNDIGGITGELREPNVEIIYGDRDSETIHRENGVKFKLDPQKVMFSSGNMDERIRMATVLNQDEIVVDLFAGIGYFTLPIAVHNKPRKIYAVEKNPIAFKYLEENIVLNNVTSIVEPVFGDNEHIAPKNVANRVIMGYIGDTYRFLNIGFSCLKNNSGIIHFHDKYPVDIVPDKPFESFQNLARKLDLNINLLSFRKVKSFAPGINHYVFDLEIDER
ncbi:MAG: class I SAM-dependent methyltransferase family protein [Thermoplasmatales archaeon]|nr:MAG: class I SAM-dependent methyltransferase family protein [Thermoplasmatales archaeon]